MSNRRCPDGGWCHHECLGVCERVNGCAPLSGVYPGDEWPEEVLEAHEAPPSMARMARRISRDFLRGSEVPDSDPCRIDIVLADGIKVSLRVEYAK